MSDRINKPEGKLKRQPLLAANRLLAAAAALPGGDAGDESALEELAALAVPALADWCIVHALRTDGTAELTALACADPDTLPRARAWAQGALPADDVDGLPAALRGSQPKLVSGGAARIDSYLIVPLIARARALGAITFVLAGAGRAFDADALAIAENFAHYAAGRLDSAQIHDESREQRAAEQGRTAERLRRSEAMVRALFRISRKSNETLNLEKLLGTLAREAIQIVNGESGFVALRATEGLTVRRCFQNSRMVPCEHTWRAGEDIPGWVLEHRVPYAADDAAADPCMRHDLPINAGVRSVLCTPILDPTGRVLGCFEIRNKRDAPAFSPNDQETLVALSAVASIAVRNALMYEQRAQAERELSGSYARLRALAAKMEAVREEERISIARELHDQLGQALTALKYDLAQLTARLAGTDPTLAREAKAITAQVDALVKTVRRIATELRPGVLDNLGLAASIEWQAREFQKRTGILCAVDAPEQPFPLTAVQRTALFRIFQEALTNVARHAGARHVRVSLKATAEGVALRIHDDGRGMPPAAAADTRSLGLLGMRERAELLGGAFAIRSAPGKGTTVTVSIPCTPDRA